jgi:glyoxylate utilization-related uncharacterized protein
MAKNPFAKMIRDLPKADIAFKGVKGWISQAKDNQVVFMNIAPIGIVVGGAMDLTIGGRTQTYRQDDSYYIPAGTVHAARFQERTYVIDVFADKKRYKAKKANG